MQKEIYVVAAAIVKNGKLLAFQRSEKMSLPGKWEFPGGKIETGENHHEALKREILEELDAQINIIDFINTASYKYDFGTVIMSTYYCELISSEFSLKEHSNFRWLSSSDILSIDWAPVDIPAAHLLVKKLGEQ